MGSTGMTNAETMQQRQNRKALEKKAKQEERRRVAMLSAAVKIQCAVRLRNARRVLANLRHIRDNRTLADYQRDLRRAWRQEHRARFKPRFASTAGITLETADEHRSRVLASREERRQKEQDESELGVWGHVYDPIRQREDRAAAAKHNQSSAMKARFQALSRATARAIRLSKELMVGSAPARGGMGVATVVRRGQ